MATSHRRPALIALLILAAAVVASLVLSAGSSGHRHSFWGRAGAPANAAHEAAFERRHGGEADRDAASTPAAEQVANRAYPRSYVDDRRAARGRAAYQGLA